MSLLRRGRTEQRSVTFQDVWGAAAGSTELGVGGMNHALRLIPVYAATSLIADLLSTTPLSVFRQSGDVRSRMPRQPQLVTNPDPYERGSIVSWLHQGIASVLLTGNAYGYITATDAAGVPSKIVWLNPYDIAYYEEQNDPLYRGTFWWRGRLLDTSLLVHIPGYLVPGTAIGLSPLALFKKQIETGLSAQQFTLDWFENGAAPAGHMKNTAQTLTGAQADAVKRRVKAAVAGRDVLVTGNDWDWQALAVPGDQAQFLESIKANATQIAAIYRVSPEDIGGETGASLTYKTLEADGIRLNQRALRPWAARFEAALTNLLPRPQYAKFDLDVNARSTFADRMNGYTAALRNGVLTGDEVRALEDRPPLTDDEIVAWQSHYAQQGKTPLADNVTAGATDPTDPTDPEGGTSGKQS